MSVKNVETPFGCHVDHDCAHRFTGIRELGFNARGAFVIDAHTTPAVPAGGPRGGYFTSIPLSPIEYRRLRPTQAAFARAADRLTIYDDWGCPHHIEAPAEIIDALVAECIANEIPGREAAERRRA